MKKGDKMTNEKKKCPFCGEIAYVSNTCGSCGMRGNGKFLKEHWGINCKQARYRENGMFYQTPDRFPAALTSPQGYAIFQSYSDLESCDGVTIGPNNLKKTNVKRPGISNLQRFVSKSMDNFEPLGEVFEEKPLGPEGYVYAMINPSFPGWVKVGCAFNCEDRLKSYQTGDPHREYKMCTKRQFSDRQIAEKIVHSKLTPLSENRKGEWFEIDLSIVKSIINNVTIV
jgi:hypothetical protein